VHPFVKNSLREASRAWVLRSDAARPHAAAWSRVRLGVPLVLLVVTWTSVGPAAEFLALQAPAGGSALAAAGGLLAAVGSLVLGVLAGVAVAAQVLDTEPLMRAWPVPRHLFFVPEIVSIWTQGVWLVLLSAAPLAATFAAAAGGGLGRACLAALGALAIYGLAAAVFSVLGALLLRLRASASVHATLAGLVIVAFGVFVTTVVFVSTHWAADGLAGLGRAAARLDERSGMPFLTALGGGTDRVLALLVVALAASGAGPGLASALLERARDGLLAGGGPQAGRPLALPFRRILGPRLGPFLRKDLTVAQREPGILLRQVLVVAAFVVLLLHVLPSSRDAAMLVYVVLTLPAALCGVTLLHAVGQEGTLLQMMRVVGAIDRFLASKLAVGLATVPVVSLGLGLLAMRIVLDPPAKHLAAVVVCIVLASVFDVLLALGLGALCADVAVKRLGKDRGISIAGEMTFWTLSGFVALGLYLVAGAVLDGRESTIPGLLLVFLTAATSAVLYQRGRARLLAPEDL
jgi:hypothetical protein